MDFPGRHPAHAAGFPEPEKTPGGMQATMVSTLSLARLFFGASGLHIRYIPRMYTIPTMTIEARHISIIWEHQTHYPDGTEEVEYQIENLIVLVPKFQRCERTEPLLSHFRWN